MGIFRINIAFALLLLSLLCSSWCGNSLIPRKLHSKSSKSSFLKPNSFIGNQNCFLDIKAVRDSVEVENQELNFKEDVFRSVAWAAAASGFAAMIAAYKGQAAAIEFSSGYLLELCLSVDNLFVFLILFDYFKVDTKHQAKILKYGIFGAVVLRGLFIGAGSLALSQFHEVLLLFAGFLAYSSFKILTDSGDSDSDDEDVASNPVVQVARRFLKTTDRFDNDKFFTVDNGAKVATPLFLCLICVELSDIVFALDSVPAIFGITEDPFIVYSSNIFAIAGLRALFGVLSKAVKELQYLDKAVGVVLGVISAKMIAETFDVELLSPLQSLLAVISILSIGVASSLATKRASSA